MKTYFHNFTFAFKYIIILLVIKMKNRDLYLNKLISWKNNELIKIISGMRRCGKSTLLQLFKEHLLSVGVKENEIIFINFESADFNEIDNYRKLQKYIKENISEKKTYILLDEVQLVEKWEKAINSFRVDFDCDIYITGSNAYLLSSELSTLLSGRYVQIKMYPLSFKEYLEFNDFDEKMTIEDKFNEYLVFGGLPSINTLDKNEQLITPFLKDIYSTVLMKDVVGRNNIKDVALLENIMSFMSQNIGNIISPKKISDTINSNGKVTNHITVENYLTMLEKAFILYKVPRYDIKGKLLLKTLAKYYIVDIGLRNAIIGYRNTDRGHILENIVYFELLRRGYEVTIGKSNENEIDFIASNFDEKKYYQVTHLLSDENINREVNVLLNISDNYEKIIISSNKDYILDKKGVKLVNIIDFLLEDV